MRDFRLYKPKHSTKLAHLTKSYSLHPGLLLAVWKISHIRLHIVGLSEVDDRRIWWGEALEGAGSKEANHAAPWRWSFARGGSNQRACIWSGFEAGEE